MAGILEGNNSGDVRHIGPFECKIKQPVVEKGVEKAPEEKKKKKRLTLSSLCRVNGL